MAPTKKTTTTKPKPKETKQRRSVMAGHEEEFARVILAPKLLELLVANKGQLTMTALCSKYNTKHGAALSPGSLKKYCDLMGWKYERVPMWTGIEPPTGMATPNVTSTPGLDLGEHAREVLTAPDNDPPASPVGVVGTGLPGQHEPHSAFEQDVVG